MQQSVWLLSQKGYYSMPIPVTEFREEVNFIAARRQGQPWLPGPSSVAQGREDLEARMTEISQALGLIWSQVGTTREEEAQAARARQADLLDKVGILEETQRGFTGQLAEKGKKQQALSDENQRLQERLRDLLNRQWKGTTPMDKITSDLTAGQTSIPLRGQK